jgi:phospho-2-dehydro-3-deoxyheptonate aldolase
MTATTDDLRIQQITELISPEQLVNDIGVTKQGGVTVANARQMIHRILNRRPIADYCWPLLNT